MFKNVLCKFSIQYLQKYDLKKYISSIVIIVIVENQVYLFEMIDYMFYFILKFYFKLVYLFWFF